MYYKYVPGYLEGLDLEIELTGNKAMPFNRRFVSVR